MWIDFLTHPCQSPATTWALGVSMNRGVISSNTIFLIGNAASFTWLARMRCAGIRITELRCRISRGGCIHSLCGTRIGDRWKRRPMPERLLIIKWGALGDVVLATSHLETVISHFPDHECWLLTAPDYAPLFEHHPRLRVKAFPRRGAAVMWKAAQWVRAMRFEQIFDFQGSERSAFLTWISGAPLRAGMGFRLPYTHSIHFQGYEREHIFDRLNRLLLHVGLPEADPNPILHLPTDEIVRAEAWLRKKQLVPGSFVIQHAGSSVRWLSKRWPAEYFAVLAERLQERGLTTVWVGSGEDLDLNRFLSSRTGVDATDAFGVTELCAVARHARLAIVNDSGPMHLLSTAAIPVYAFFGPTDWRKSHAVGQKERVLIGNAECSPCHLEICPAKRAHKCLRGITPEYVLGRIEADGLLAPAADSIRVTQGGSCPSRSLESGIH
ncbi:MAG: glycosyltransferase family 9 protein [Chloroflexi bacterium]|nr:MAG: glycosyltransferase family 9 protein [Chloroflexota bacterium]